VRFVLIGVWLPIVICSVMTTSTLCLVLGIMIRLHTNDQSVLADNFAGGLLVLMVGLSFVALGWRQLYQLLLPAPAPEV
jgi:TRAP-type C4-dicarboxylate transport system permease small subunit